MDTRSSDRSGSLVSGSREEIVRVAIYYVPDRQDTLWTAGTRWLGRDPESGEILGRPQVPGLAQATRKASRYGFHATLKAPMPIRKPLAEMINAVKASLSTVAPFSLPPLRLTLEDGFVALRLGTPCPRLADLADRCVRDFDDFRVPYTAAAEKQIRASSELTSQNLVNLKRWGYPYVFSEWVFHMTLSDRQPNDHIFRMACDFFAESATRPRRVSAVGIFVEPEPQQDFILIARIPLAGGSDAYA